MTLSQQWSYRISVLFYWFCIQDLNLEELQRCMFQWHTILLQIFKTIFTQKQKNKMQLFRRNSGKRSILNQHISYRLRYNSCCFGMLLPFLSTSWFRMPFWLSPLIPVLFCRFLAYEFRHACCKTLALTNFPQQIVIDNQLVFQIANGVNFCRCPQINGITDQIQHIDPQIAWLQKLW